MKADKRTRKSDVERRARTTRCAGETLSADRWSYSARGAKNRTRVGCVVSDPAYLLRWDDNLEVSGHARSLNGSLKSAGRPVLLAGALARFELLTFLQRNAWLRGQVGVVVYLFVCFGRGHFALSRWHCVERELLRDALSRLEPKRLREIAHRLNAQNFSDLWDWNVYVGSVRSGREAEVGDACKHHLSHACSVIPL